MAYVLYSVSEEYKFKVIAQFIENIRLLTKRFPGRDELIDELNTNMFDQINTRAFNELVYYLNNLEYMAKTEETFVNWPLTHDNEKCLKIIEHVTKLNNIYEGANIPIPSLELLFLPEGFKVIEFFLKWSELCMLVHLRTLPKIFPQILHRIKPNKDLARTEVMLKVMQEQVAGVNIQISSMINTFSQQMKQKEMYLFVIEGNRNDLRLDTFLTNISNRYPANIEHDTFSKLIRYSDEFLYFSEIFDEIGEIKTHFINEKNVLVHHGDVRKKTLALHPYFFKLNIFLKNGIHDFVISSRKCSEASEKAEQLLQIYSAVNTKLQKKIDAFKSELEKINEDKISDLVDIFDLLVTPLA